MIRYILFILCTIFVFTSSNAISRSYESEQSRFISRDPIGLNVRASKDSDQEYSMNRDGPSLYNYSLSNSTNMVDPLGLQAVAQKKTSPPANMPRCKYKDEDLTCHFDGLTFRCADWYVDAISGIPTFSKEFTALHHIPRDRDRYPHQRDVLSWWRRLILDYSKASQDSSKGPLPRGRYWIYTGWKNSGRTSGRHFGTELRASSAWGAYSWELQIYPKTTLPKARTGFFFIHGGTEYKSAGCIDLRYGEKEFNRFLNKIIRQNICDCYLDVVANYGLNEKKVNYFYESLYGGYRSHEMKVRGNTFFPIVEPIDPPY